MMKKFTFGSTFEEIDIDGEVFKIDISDESTFNYQKSIEDFYKKLGEFSDQDISKMSTDEQREMLLKRRKDIENIVEAILGEGTFERLFEKAGKSTVNFMPVVFELVGMFVEKSDSVHKSIENKYLKKKRK